VRACELIRRMYGGAQAAMVLTDHGKYVVKWKQNAQHRRILINEVLAAELLRRIGIASPDWAMVHADPEFLYANPLVGIHLRHSVRPVECGWHFGSKVPLNRNGMAILDSLPHHILTRIDNLPDFLRVFVFDLWIDNSDRRQAIFFVRKGRRFSTQMIDNGHAFGFDGSEWRMSDRFVGKEFPPLSKLYLSAEADKYFESTITCIQSIVASGFDTILQSVPADWIENDMNLITRLFEDLHSRSKRIPDLLTDAKGSVAEYVKSDSVFPDGLLWDQDVEYPNLRPAAFQAWGGSRAR
jgi:hypothetical protein